MRSAILNASLLRPWVVVLAAGEGKRLQSITLDERGNVVPKQYWRFDGENSMLGSTLLRAQRIAARERIVAVVDPRHRMWWKDQLRDLPQQNIVVQPTNRGTAAGVLLPLLLVYRQDPNAVVVTLPSDHAVDDEDTMAGVVRRALLAAEEEPEQLVLLGVEPNAPDPELGWIVARGAGRSARPVAAFVEKPDPDAARSLFEGGALWNTFILAGRVRAFIAAFERAEPGLLQLFVEEMADSRFDDAQRLEALYLLLPSLDFSRHVLQPFPSALRVLRAASCGWSDLGTPARLSRWLQTRAAEMSA